MLAAGSNTFVDNNKTVFDGNVTAGEGGGSMASTIFTSLSQETTMTLL
jgi:hypothetical protein